jgi:hypothetical protein
MNLEGAKWAVLFRNGERSSGNSQDSVEVCPMNIPLTKASYDENARRFFMVCWVA